MKRIILFILAGIMLNSCDIGTKIWFKEDDLNSDGQISYEEFHKNISKDQGMKDYAKLNDITVKEGTLYAFEKYDVDKNSALTKKEFNQFLKHGW